MSGNAPGSRPVGCPVILPGRVRAYPLTCPRNAPPPSRSARACTRTRTRSSSSEYAAELSLDDIARRVASSRRQLQRAYAEIGNTTFRDHLTRVRMERAAELLARRGADRARGRPPRRLPPAGPVRQGVPPPPRRRAVGLPRPPRASRGHRRARRLSPAGRPRPGGRIGSLRRGTSVTCRVHGSGELMATERGAHDERRESRGAPPAAAGDRRDRVGHRHRARRC